jgi:arylsulfatase
MECFAAFLEYTDDQLGRVLEHLERTGDLDDTLVVLVSDNGASSEGGMRGSINDARLWNGLIAGRKELRERIDEIGGPSAHNNYPWGWTMAGNTPFQRWKREVHEGGIADPCILRLPGRVAAGAIRHQFTHAIDLFPTVLELAGIEAPSEIGEVPQSPIDGTSFAYALAEDAEQAPERHTTQYFEMLGCRAIYHDGWKAVTFKPSGRMYDDGIDPDAPFDDDVWELYDKRNDFAESVDLAAQEPERLAELVDLWWAEARRNDVLPLDNRPLAAFAEARPTPADGRGRFVYRPGGAPVPERVAVNVRHRPHSITASVVVPDEGPVEGVLLALGSVLGGFSLYLLDGVLVYAHNLVGTQLHRVSATRPVGPGAHRLRMEYTPNADFSGVVRLLVDDEVVGDGTVAFFTPVQFSNTGGGLTCGYEVGPAVSPDYTEPFRATVTIDDVVVEVSGPEYRDPMALFAAVMATQ